METNMPKNEITELVKMQLGDMASWDIVKYSLSGSGEMAAVYSMPGQYAYVMVPNQETVDEAASLIKQTMGAEE